MPENRVITILAVDDNDALRYSLSRSLRGGGYAVVEAKNGAEALRLAEECPDLITLDVHLPDVDGLEICRRLKANPTTSHIPVLHISATFVHSEDRVRGLASADGYLAEPISREELLATVAALLRMKQAEHDAQVHAAEAENARQELKKTHGELELRVQERTRELAQRNEKIRELGGRLLKMQDDERRRIARELHDSTGQMLTAMKMKLDRLARETENPSARSLLVEATEINEELTRQLRTMSYLLHPPLLDEVGLVSALGWYFEGFSQRSGIEVTFETDPDFGRLSSDVEIVIFRVVQECLTNIHRHSGSSTARVEVRRREKNVGVKITDTGKGITAAKFQNGEIIQGIGMMGIQERVHQLSGTVEITSSDKGTTVTVLLPTND